MELSFGPDVANSLDSGIETCVDQQLLVLRKRSRFAALIAFTWFCACSIVAPALIVRR